MQEAHASLFEVELWHGTNCNVLPELLRHGLQPPADSEPSDACDKCANKRLHTTLCSNRCQHCCRPHTWDRCHMYGMGVYLADLALKSHAYVRPTKETVNISGRSRVERVYSL